jgi:squalene-hopene/tetraprenyl-beta-curcumene cyclase
MNLEVDSERLALASKAVRAEVLAERTSAGCWTGELSSSPFATAAAVSALVIAHRRRSKNPLLEMSSDERSFEQVVQGDLSELLVESVQWLGRQQNPDGGWGDCLGARSNIAATMLVQAAFRLTGIPGKFTDLMARADDYVAAAGGAAGLRRHCGKDKPLLAAIMTNCALADVVSWHQVPTLQFEVPCLAKRWHSELQAFSDRLATPIVLGVGRAKFHHDPPVNPISRLLRRSLREKSLMILEQLQAADDSFLASVPITAFVIMSIGSIGCQDHSIVRRGIEFLLSAVRADSSWSISPNLAVTNTALAINCLTAPPATAHNWQLGAIEHNNDHDDSLISERCLDWLIGCQRREPNSVTEVPEGGWSVSDSIGSLPNTVATSQVLSVLARLHRNIESAQRERIDRVVGRGIAWLLNLQNENGGWPTFYRGEAFLQFDHGGIDATAEVLRSLASWQRVWRETPRDAAQRRPFGIEERMPHAIENGFRFLESQQREDGSLIPLWFGNEHQPSETNPVIGTAQVLLTCAELHRKDSKLAQRAARWLVTAQHTNGGWGPPRAPINYSGAEGEGLRGKRANEASAQFCSIAESALAISGLLTVADFDASFSRAAARGLHWLIDAIEHDNIRRPAIIGFYLSKLWYHERLYPLVFAAGALTRALRGMTVRAPAISHIG